MSTWWVPYLMYVWQIFKLQENKRTLDWLTKTNEAALLEAKRTVEAVEAKASQVDDLQNRNQVLMKHIEICQSSGEEDQWWEKNCYGLMS